MVDLLTEEALFNNMGVEVFFGLQQQRTGTGSRVINFIDAGLLMHGQLSNKLGYMLRGTDNVILENLENDTPLMLLAF